MKLFVVLFFEIVLLVPSVFSQVVDYQLNADSLFLVARQEAINENYDKAIALSHQILGVYPDYKDVRLLLARTYAWQKNFEAAKENVFIILKKDSSDYEANNALIDFYLWSGDYDAGIMAANNALSFYPRDIGLLEKKIKIYMASKNYEEARKTFRGIKKTDPGHQSISELMNSQYQTGYSNIFSVEHSIESFNEPYHRRWHISSFGYGRKTSAGVFYGKIYLGDVVRSGEGLFSNDVSAQYALELYPRINKQNYLFLNYAFSGGSNFPQDRVGVEFYHTFGKAIEGSLGYRYLYFNPDEGDKVHIHIYTGALSSYLGKYWVSFRPFIVSDGTDTSHKYSISLRRFLQKEENYLELILGTGTSPDNPAFYTNGENVPKLGSWRAELLWKQRIFNNLIFEIQGGYEKTEYVSDSWRNQLAFRTSLSYVF